MRYASEKPFPSYAYLPGRDPHPTRDARGHSFGGEKKRHPYLPAESWRENEEYLFGVDLYNHGYLWEAHEAWENLWHPAKHDAEQAGFLQGLIQCTAASLKIPMEQPLEEYHRPIEAGACWLSPLDLSEWFAATHA